MLINEKQYNKYLEEINDLIDKDPDPLTPEGERIFLLALALKELSDAHIFLRQNPTFILKLKSL